MEIPQGEKANEDQVLCLPGSLERKRQTREKRTLVKYGAKGFAVYYCSIVSMTLQLSLELSSLFNPKLQVLQITALSRMAPLPRT